MESSSHYHPPSPLSIQNFPRGFLTKQVKLHLQKCQLLFWQQLIHKNVKRQVQVPAKCQPKHLKTLQRQPLYILSYHTKTVFQIVLLHQHQHHKLGLQLSLSLHHVRTLLQFFRNSHGLLPKLFQVLSPKVHSHLHWRSKASRLSKECSYQLQLPGKYHSYIA